MSVQDCLTALRAQYPVGSSDQEILYGTCDYPSSDEEDHNHLRCLLDYGQVDINFRYPDEIALMRAAISGNTEMVEILCEKGANVLLIDDDGNTALMLAQEERDAWVNEDDGGGAPRRDRIVEILTTYTQAATGGVVPVAAVAAVPLPVAAAAGPLGGGGAAAANLRPAINERMDQMPNAWRETNLDDMTCPVCRGLYYKPLTFSCGHSLCKPCFGMIPGGLMRKCPECRQKIGTENPQINIVIQKRCDKLRALAAKHFSNSNYQYNNSFGFNSPRAGTKGGKRTRKQRLFNSPKGGPKTRGIKYATAANARKSIKLIRRKDKTRRKSIAMRMYYRAKYHKYQTPGMRGAMKVWKKYIDTI
jgi:hypothetical protein